jgi:hypothetical protein
MTRRRISSLFDRSVRCVGESRASMLGRAGLPI